jgi:electron transport complex protein RnfB
MVIVNAVAVTGGIGIVCGVLLALASKLFTVEVDDKVVEIRNLLPGANCGACGYAGCDEMAAAIAEGMAPADGCPVSSSEKHSEIAALMGTTSEESEKKVAHVMCKGCNDLASKKYEYDGVKDCKAASAVQGGNKSCDRGCLGFGTCMEACKFDAIKIIDGVAVVDKEKCTACGKCIEECPKALIEFVPYKNNVIVGCHNKDFGKAVKGVCKIGCIGCKMCEKNCEFDAIHVVDNLAKVDYDKCTQCMVCVEKCPVSVIQGKEA